MQGTHYKPTFLGVSRTTLAKWSKLKEDMNDPAGKGSHALCGRASNRTKWKGMTKRLFKGLVNTLRTTTGKARGKHKFWLVSTIKRISPSCSKASPKYKKELKGTLFQRFQQLLDYYVKNGTESPNQLE